MILSDKQREVLVFLDGAHGRASVGQVRRETGARASTLVTLKRLGLAYRDTYGLWHITPDGRDALRTSADRRRDRP